MLQMYDFSFLITGERMSFIHTKNLPDAEAQFSERISQTIMVKLPGGKNWYAPAKQSVFTLNHSFDSFLYQLQMHRNQASFKRAEPMKNKKLRKADSAYCFSSLTAASPAFSGITR